MVPGPGQWAADVAVIGAGMAGAACAHGLAERGRTVALFDKGRSVGGRLAQRRTVHGTFDHGAQYIRARDPGFSAFMTNGVAAGWAEPWPAATGGGEVPYIGTPGMNAPVKALLRGLELRCETRITAIAGMVGAFALVDDRGGRHGPFGQVVLAVPAPQAALLLREPDHPVLRDALASVVMAPCWAGLLAFAVPLDDLPEAVRFERGALVWAARHRTKPGRGTAESWTVHAGPEWSRGALERSPDEIAPALLRLFADAIGRDLPPPVQVTAHRWRHALVERPLGRPCMVAGGIGLCGDWCLGPRVEAAFLSGRALAAALLP